LLLFTGEWIILDEKELKTALEWAGQDQIHEIIEKELDQKAAIDDLAH